MTKTNAVHKQYITFYLKSLDLSFKMLTTEGKIHVTQKYFCDFFSKRLNHLDPVNYTIVLFE